MVTKEIIVNFNEVADIVEGLVRNGKSINIRQATTGSGDMKCYVKWMYVITYEEGE